ncbi:MAG: permease-like cell division protein FtsX [Candidatus Marinimicrobia bacterium]|jgi:cell division transport system permease protein|nr:permease-like cell division protein FtsX [Candidatus Neomarinimicrobiota bacterium]|tara:strand:+ start:850 stop:1722 length:873 start_codon:yes stop_codon:yes gene_type:complete
MDKFLYLLTEGVKNTWRHKMTAFTAIFSLFIALYIVGLLATAGNNTHKVLHYLRSKYKIEVFFKQDVSNEEAVGLIHRIKKIKGVRTATIIEKEDAMRIFKDQFGENITDILGYNPLPVSAVVNVDRTRRNPLRVEPIIKEIRTIDRVEEIRYQGNLINKIEMNYKRVSDRFPYFSGIIIFIAVLIIYNTIKLSVYSRRDLIRSLQLIGATRLFVKLPFIIEGIFIGLISVILVFPALMGTVKGVNYMVSNFTSMNIKLTFDTSVWIWLFALVVVITLIGSYRAASSFLK